MERSDDGSDQGSDKFRASGFSGALLTGKLLNTIQFHNLFSGNNATDLLHTLLPSDGSGFFLAGLDLLSSPAVRTAGV